MVCFEMSQEGKMRCESTTEDFGPSISPTSESNVQEPSPARKMFIIDTDEEDFKQEDIDQDNDGKLAEANSAFRITPKGKKWTKGDFVMVDWNGCSYKAKIIGVSESEGESHYKIHYHGWSSKWDQAIPESKTDKWEAFTAKAEEAAKEHIDGLKTEAKGRKRCAGGRGEGDAISIKKQK